MITFIFFKKKQCVHFSLGFIFSPSFSLQLRERKSDGKLVHSVFVREKEIWFPHKNVMKCFRFHAPSSNITMLSIYIVVDRIKFSQFDAIQLENNLILCWNRMGKINYGKWRRWKKHIMMEKKNKSAICTVYNR